MQSDLGVIKLVRLHYRSIRESELKRKPHTSVFPVSDRIAVFFTFFITNNFSTKEHRCLRHVGTQLRNVNTVNTEAYSLARYVHRVWAKVQK